MTAYAELHCITNFSFLRGASHPGELVAQAADLGYRALAITDECSLAGVVRAHEAARAYPQLKLIIGSEFVLPTCHLVALVQDHTGYRQLSRLITLCRRRADKGCYQFAVEDVWRTGIDRLSHCLVLLVPAERPHFNPNLNLELKQVKRWRELFEDRLWLGMSALLGPDDQHKLRLFSDFSVRLQIPLLACGQVHMHCRERRALQDVLTATRLKQTVTECVARLHPNGERHLRPIHTLQRLYPPDLLANSVIVAERCNFSLDQLRYQYPHEVVPPGKTPMQHLAELVTQGAGRRWPDGVNTAIQKQIDHELDLIEELDYACYFLTVHDLVAFARQKNILCQGRGSAANSVVCFCLGITEVDPARMNTLFERFISRERNEPPDIDVDFEHQRREEVIQYLYRKYGRERAALTATVISYRLKSALRDAARALGFTAADVDRLSGVLSWWDRAEALNVRLAELGFDPASRNVRQLLALTRGLVGFPRHLSQHVGGFVISEQPLSELVPVENAAMVGRTVIQWDKDDLDSLGLLKVDCLALGMLTAIHKSFDLIESHHGKSYTLASVPAEDPAVYDMLCRGDSFGVFQVESRAQVSMLSRLKPRCFYDLVVEIAIVRPGPIQGGMVHPYLRRREGREPVRYPSPAVQQILERTLGVPIFQEQVMQIAMQAAGFSAGEADQLRRAMAAWRRRGGLEPFRERLLKGMLANGCSTEFAEQIFEQIKGFGEYGFPESHSASFALLVYASAWLKCHYPAAFCCALLNSQPLGFYTPSQLLQEVRRHGVRIYPCVVEHSNWDSNLETVDDHRSPAIRLGFSLIRGFSKAAAERISSARHNGVFRDSTDLAERAALDRRERRLLADAGALRGLAGHRHRARWEVAAAKPGSDLLAGISRPDSRRTTLPIASAGDDLFADYSSMGLTLGQHPMAFLRSRLNAFGELDSRRMRRLRHGQYARVSGIVTNRQRPSTAKGTLFITLEDEFGNINIIVWPDLAERQRSCVLGARVLSVYGELQRQGEVRHLLARNFLDRSSLLQDLNTRSRNFR